MARSGFGKRFPRREAAAAKLLASNVKRLRKERNWTQDDLAAALGIEQQAVSLIENARSNPTILMVDAISRALGAQVAELFELRPRTTRPARSAETDRNSRGSRPKG
jgi:transcriptional regulator with XRE-family HTH domain